ncbi:LuxR C-terminal-related transcriptional regulator [Actinoplanes sp. NPDC051861]|uniref:helix-turn-helix transcriptional regulator n=1 Tax=Actinoplanes sp. NPDC051861 TaxID=3155170 RepID=UPI003433EC95
MGLRGRAAECRRLREFTGALRGGRGGVLVLRGEPGVGKTALLNHAVRGERTIRIEGVAAEAGFPYAALHRLLLPFLAEAPRALLVACGLSDGPPVDPHLVALATAAALSRAGTPLMCCVDDAHWIDSQTLTTLTLAAREDPAIGLLLATRDELPDLPSLEVTGLTTPAATRLLREATTCPLDHMVVARLVTATGGNPRALLNLTRELSADHLTGARTLPDPLPIDSRLAAHHLHQLPETTRRRLLLEAAAEEPGLTGTTAVERMARAAVYSSATGAERRQAHAVLADVTSAADLRAWHRAASCLGTDDAIADELERAADLATARDGLPARVVFLTRAAELTTNDQLKADRLLAAATAAIPTGAAPRALRLAESTAVAGPKTDIVRLKAHLILGRTDPNALLEAARALIHSDRRLARVALLDAAEHALRAVPRMPHTVPAEIAGLAATLGADPTIPGQQLNAFATLAVSGHEAAVPLIRRTVHDLLNPGTPPEWHLIATALSSLLWDPEATRALWQQAITTARRTGALWHLTTALHGAATLETRLGETATAERLLAEHDRIRTTIGIPAHPFPELTAWRGGEPPETPFDPVSHVVLALGRGDYARARTAAREVLDSDPLGLHPQILADLVEAAVRGGDRVLATGSLATLTERAHPAGTDWALGVLARSRALLAPAAGAETLYQRAITLLSGTPARADLARAHLLHGEWLRRQRRRRDARAELSTALAMFERMGAAGFAARAAQELDAAAGRRGTGARLTPQETAIARLAADGATNGEIAAQLFLSANTVDHHLRKVFQKLDVTSRRQLPPALRR